MKYIAFLLSFFCFNAYSQSKLLKPNMDASLYGWYANEKGAPFWVVSNQYGRNKNTRNNSVGTLGIDAVDSIGAFSLSYRFEGDGRSSFSEQHVWFQEAWTELRYKKLYLMGGRKTEVLGIADSLIGSGGAICSANARPLPRISIGFSDFVDVPLSNGLLSVKGCLEHGWFESNRVVKSPYLHHKNFYLRVNISNNYHLFWGLEHFAQWGGTSRNPKIGKLPASFSDYIKVFTTQSGSSSNNPDLWSENANKLGNHLGSFQFGFDARFSTFKLLAYQQTFFEDGSGLGVKRKNRADGIWGISISRDKQTYLNRIVYEFIHTTRQSGSVDGKNSVIGIGGGDNYFNNGIYQSGWTYYGYVIGSPFISSPELMGNAHGTINNKVIAHYFSATGTIPRLFEYRTIVSFSRNFGLCSQAFITPKDQYSFLLELLKPISGKPNIKIGLQIAGDRGDLIGNHFAMGFCIRANNLFSR